MTYDEVTKRTGVTRCNACDVGDHTAGWADMGSGIVHWRDRRLERRGLRHFLKLVASIIYSHNRGQPEWRKLYEQNVWAYHTALAQFGVRFRSSYADEDRARAAYDARNEHLATTEPAIYQWIRDYGKKEG